MSLLTNFPCHVTGACLVDSILTGGRAMIQASVTAELDSPGANGSVLPSLDPLSRSPMFSYWMKLLVRLTSAVNELSKPPSTR